MSHSTCNHNTHHEGDCESACCRGCDRRLGLVSSLCIECCHDTAEAARESIARGLLPAFPAYDAGETICTGCESTYLTDSEEAESRWAQALRDRRHGVCGTCSTRFELKTLNDCYKKCASCAAPKRVIPRRITAAEILAERTALRRELGYIPHGTGRGWSSMLWKSCDCPNCRDEYDPTGEESAKYLNMDPRSYFTDQSEIPSFAFSKIAAESLWATATQGIYFDDDARVRTLDGFIEQMTPPLAIRPFHILHIGKDRTLDRFFLSADKSYWTRMSWKAGRSVYYKEGENPPIPADTICSRLKELFS